MNEVCRRLKIARERSGFKSAREAAAALGVSLPTYIQHENGRRGVTVSKAALYAKKFKVSEEWLLLGRGATHPDGIEEVVRLFEDIPEDRKEQAIGILRILASQ